MKPNEESKHKIKPVISSRLPSVFYYKSKPKQPVPRHQKAIIKSDQYSQVIKALKKIERISSFSQTADREPFTRISQVNLQQLVTLSISNDHSTRAAFSKALDASSLRLYIVKTLPINKLQDSSTLKNYFKNWTSAQDTLRGLSNLSGIFWNKPQGFVSLVSQPFQGGTLAGLISSTGALPEKLLSEVARQVLLIYKQVQEATQISGIGNFEVLFDRSGSVKLGMDFPDRGIEYRDHIYFLGYMILWAALGQRDVIDQTFRGHCCLFHSIECPLIQRFTPQFKEFLCLVLKENPQKLPSPDQVLNLQWFNLREYPGADVSMEDLMNLAFPESEEHKNIELARLVKACECIGALIDGRRYPRPSSEAIRRLAEDVRLPYQEVKQQIVKIYRKSK